MLSVNVKTAKQGIKGQILRLLLRLVIKKMLPVKYNDCKCGEAPQSVQSIKVVKGAFLLV